MNKKFSPTQQIGNQAELYITQRLQSEGFTILARNYRQAYGEIDIIAQQGDTIAFVEVKRRASLALDPGELVGHSKQRKIIMVAKQYLAQEKITEKYCRFDVALVYTRSNTTECLYLANAFTQEGI